MLNLSDTMGRLLAMRDAAETGHLSAAADRLTKLSEFGSNPGALEAHTYIPSSLNGDAALVVVLHGCTQTAASYDVGAGWSEMADRCGFALLFPEQLRQNNPNLCFNWFAPGDNRRGSGEALSIRQMIETMINAQSIDPARVFVTGLSAGGAMASVMLATYPELFAGGAVIAGLPYGCANTIPQAFDRMRGYGTPGAAELSALVRNASDHKGPWPTISIWHGSGDATVNPNNAEAILSQWRSLHGVGADPDELDVVDGYPRRAWSDHKGREVIEEYSITDMGHGTPLDTLGANGCGKAGAYMLEASISSTTHICDFWGLAPSECEAGQAGPVGQSREASELVPSSAYPSADDAQLSRLRREPPHSELSSGSVGVGKVIEDALRAAGLMR